MNEAELEKSLMRLVNLGRLIGRQEQLTNASPELLATQIMPKEVAEGNKLMNKIMDHFKQTN